jgi:hypothetical protein
MEHTKEPWDMIRHPEPEAGGCIEIFGEGRYLFTSHPDEAIPRQQQVANVARAVACVNACAGLSPEGIPGLVEAVRGLALRYANTARVLGVDEVAVMSALATVELKEGDGYVPDNSNA